jgi:aryl-alcohol dehydrogenase-like predicted oxidoreductase
MPSPRNPVQPNADPRRIHLTPEYSISRIIVGGWQLSRGHGGGLPAGESPRRFLSELADRGFTTFDCADIYTGVEEMLGDFLRHYRGSHPAAPLQIHTKFVPDLNVLPTIHRPYVERIIHRSLSRLGVETLDLVQFHWWDFDVPGYVDVLGWLEELKAEGKIRHLAVTNFDQTHLAELVESGAEVLSNQVQYSALDRRPERALAPYCLERGISLLCYGALAGGFLTDRFLGRGPGTAPGTVEPREQPVNRSLVKYRLIIEEMGGWDRFQVVLSALSGVAKNAGLPLPAAAIRYVLSRPGVAATITGVDTLAHADELLSALDRTFPPDAWEALEAVLADTPPPPGPVYGLERVLDGPHGAIMRYNLNEE